VGYRPKRERLTYWILIILAWHAVLLFAGKKRKNVGPLYGGDSKQVDGKGEGS